MKYFIKNYNDIWMPVYFNIDEDDGGVMIMIFSTANDIENPFCIVHMVPTSHGYIQQIHKMECEVKTADLVITFLKEQLNWKP